MTITYLSRKHLLHRVKKRNHRERRSILAINLLLVFIGLAVGFSFLSMELSSIYKELPNIDSIRDRLAQKTENSFIYDRNGTLLYTFKSPNVDREYLPSSEITDLVKLVAIAAEDKDFYKHHGVDYLATIKASIQSFTDSDSRIAGGSTLTQQLAKNTFLTSERSLIRKLKEVILSFVIESDYSKDQIMEYYLNTITFGSRVTGLKTAAKVYFSKTVAELNFNEVAFLISIVQSPNELSPLYTHDQEAAWKNNNQRRQYIINQVLTNYDYFGSILSNLPTKADLEGFKESTVALNPSITDIKAPHFVFYVQSILSKPPYNISTGDLYTGGYHIYTTLDLKMQEIAEQEVLAGVNRLGGRYNFNNAALITIDPRNGDVLAMQGSKNYWASRDPGGKFDPHVNVTLSSQNLGSSLKPFLTYLAFSSKKYSRYTTILDTPQTFAGGYQPKNVDGKFLGPMSIDTALKLSRNLPFVKILNQVGVSNFVGLLKQLGYTNANKGADYGLSAALGGVSETLFDHTYAYGTLANNGIRVTPRPITKIVNKEGKASEYAASSSRIMNAGPASEVNRILGDKSYTASNHWMVTLSGAYKFAGKTGTTDNNKQNYYIGYSPALVTAIWAGNNNNVELRGDAFGSTTALPIWHRYTQRVLQQFPSYAVRGSY